MRRRKKKNKHSDSQKLIAWSQIYLGVPIPHWRHMSLCPPLHFAVESQPEVKHLNIQVESKPGRMFYRVHQAQLQFGHSYVVFNFQQ